MLVQVILIAIPCWLKRTEQSRTLQCRWLVPGSKRQKREQRSYDARDRDASLRLKSVSSDQSAVSRVEKGRMSRRVSWRVQDAQGAAIKLKLGPIMQFNAMIVLK